MATASSLGQFLLDLGKGVITPFRKGVAIGTEGAESIVRKFQGGQLSKEQEEALKKLQSKIASDDEIKAIEKDPLRESAKALAGQTAFFAPVPKGLDKLSTVQKILKAGGYGAVPGALSGYGASKEGEELQSTLGGAALGAALGVGFEGVKGIGRKFLERKNKLPTVSGAKLDKTPSFETTREEMARTAQEIGITDRMGASQKVKTIDTSFQKLQDDIGVLLKGKKPVAEKTILDNLEKNYINSNIDETVPATKRLLTQALNKLDEAQGSNEKLNALKTFARKEMGNFFDKGGANPTQKQEVWSMVYNTAKDSLDSVSPAIRTINNKQKVLFDLSEEFVPAAVKSVEKANFKVPFTDINIPLGVTKEGVQRGVGAVARGAGELTGIPMAGRVAGLAGAGIEKLPPALQAALRNVAISQTSGATDQPQAEAPQPDTSGLDTSTIDRSTLPEDKQRALDIIDQAEAGGAGAGIGRITPEMAMMGQLLLSPSEAKKLQAAYTIQLQSEKEGKSSSPKSETAIGILDELKGIYSLVQQQGLTAGSGGVLERAKGAVKGGTAAITQSSPEAATYKDTGEAFLSLISRGLGESGVLTDKDIDRVKKAIPSFSDSPEAAAKKWKTIENILMGASQKEAALGTIDSAGSETDQLLQLLQSQGLSL